MAKPTVRAKPDINKNTLPKNYISEELNMSKRLHSFVFTINNWTDEDYSNLLTLPSTYIIIGKENGTEQNTPHLQGYCELIRKVSFNKLKKMIPRAHLERRLGSSQQASDYCKKENNYYEHGKLSNPGKRNDLELLYEGVKNGSTDSELSDAYPCTYMKFYKAVDRVRLNFAREDNKWEPITVTVLHGEAESGKTRKAYETDPDLYRLMPSTPLWWDGYAGQETVLIDDYYGEIQYSFFLQLLDGYKFQLPIKGGHTWKQWKHVIITSNAPPDQWYNGMTPALKRRLTNIVAV